MAKASNMPELLGINAAARLLNLSVDYVRTLADDGRLPCERDSENRRRFRVADVNRLMRQRQKLPAARRGDA